MILTVTLNPAIDRSYGIDHFKSGDRYRIFDVTESIGGKGINVGKVLHQLGHQVITTGFYGGYNGQRIISYLEQENLPNRFIKIESESRNFCVINDIATNKETILNEAGPKISKDEIEHFLSVYKELIANKECKWVVIAGSVPQDVPESIYFDMVSLAKAAGKQVVVDGKPPYINNALVAKPHLIKPNKREFMDLCSMKEWNLDKALEMGAYLINRYQVKILLSLGDQGAIYMDQELTLRVEFDSIKVVNTIGSGDAMVAGYLTGVMEGLEIKQVLRKATAFSLSNALQKEIGCINELQIKQLEKQIRIHKL